jgi:hypothetical protein
LLGPDEERLSYKIVGRNREGITAMDYASVKEGVVRVTGAGSGVGKASALKRPDKL